MSINEVFLRALAESVQEWFALRDEKWREVLSEGLMLIPICEFLIARNWVVSGERSKRMILGVDDGKYRSFDIDAVRSDEKLLVECKFLKPPKDIHGRLKEASALNISRLDKDIDAMASLKACSCVLIVAFHPAVTNKRAVIDRLRQRHVELFGPAVEDGGFTPKRVDVIACRLRPPRHVIQAPPGSVGQISEA